MNALSDVPAADPSGWTPPGAAPTVIGEAEMRRLAETFAVTPEAARLAVARVGTDFRALQREFGGRR